MRTLHLDRQAALDYGGELVADSIERFLAGRAALPTWGSEVDRQVAVYVQGLEDWMVANAEWSFVSERYFGKEGPRIRASLQTPLLPARKC